MAGPNRKTDALLSDEEPDDAPPRPNAVRFTEFECPTCTANNPYDDGFSNGDELTCFHCGLGFVAVVDGEGRLKLREQ